MPKVPTKPDYSYIETTASAQLFLEKKSQSILKNPQLHPPSDILLNQVSKSLDSVESLIQKSNDLLIIDRVNFLLNQTKYNLKEISIV